jgi:hypothetical protein
MFNEIINIQGGITDKDGEKKNYKFYLSMSSRTMTLKGDLYASSKTY